jgi:hypothetical protein
MSAGFLKGFLLKPAARCLAGLFSREFFFTRLESFCDTNGMASLLRGTYGREKRESYFNREPFHTWRKTGFTRVIVQTGRKRDPQLTDTPLFAELMEKYKTPDAGKRLAKVVLAAGAFGRPMVASPGIPADRVKILREAFIKTAKDPEFVAETKKRKVDLEPVPGEELETLAKEVVNQPADIIGRMKKLLAM